MMLVLESLGGNCPVQAEGRFLDKAFYFRSRWDRMQMWVATDSKFQDALADNSAWYYEEDYPGEPASAGWAKESECIAFIGRALGEYMKGAEE